MFKSLNNSLDEKKLEENKLEKIFNTFWKAIEEELSKISKVVDTKSEMKNSESDKNEVLEEVLKLLNNQNNLLNNPEKLFPVEYLRYVFEKSSTIIYKQNQKQFLPYNKSDIRQMEMAVTMLRNQSIRNIEIDKKSTTILLRCLLNSIDSSIEFVRLNKVIGLRQSELYESYCKLRDYIEMTIEIFIDPEKCLTENLNLK